MITVNGQEIRGEKSMAGFEEDEIVPVLSCLSDIIGIGEVGLGGAHDRVWQWYAGTIDTSETELLGNPIFRRVVDEGKATYALGILPTQQFNDTPWYPITITTDGPGREETDRASWDGIHYGWYSSRVGGGGEDRARVVRGEGGSGGGNHEA